MTLGNDVLAPVIGRSLDKFPLKPAMVCFAGLYGISRVGLGLSNSLALSCFILLVPLRAALLGAGSLTVSLLIARWIKVHRGRAIILSVLGMSLGGFILAPLVGLAIGELGWRSALMLSGAVGFLLLLMLSLSVRELPGEGDVEPGQGDLAAAHEGSAQDLKGAGKVSDVLRRRDFWLIGLSTALTSSIIQGIVISIVPLAIESGISVVQGTGLVSATGGAAIAGKVQFSVFVDKVDRIALTTAMFTVVTLVNAALLMGWTPVWRAQATTKSLPR